MVISLDMTPKWIQELVIQVMIDEKKDFLPIVKFRRSSYGHYTSGTTYKPNGNYLVVISKGKYAPKKETKLVLLHELAHCLVDWGEHHSSVFWDKAFKLYRKYKVPMLYARSREMSYKKGALIAYRKNRKNK